MQSFVDIIRPSNRLSVAFDLLSIFAGSLLIALFAQISIPLGFTPVPLSMQTFAVLMIGALLGSKKGAAAVAAYIAEGALGLPVFAGGTAGISGGPSSGYLLGFILTAFLVGFLMERGWKNHPAKTLAALILGDGVTLLMGALFLSYFVGFSAAIKLGVVPFLIGESLKIAASACLIRGGWRFYHYRNGKART